MSLDLVVVSMIMYQHKGEVKPGDETKVVRYKNKIFDWKRDVVVEGADNDISARMNKVENNFDGYWCEGEKCWCKRTHWVINASETNSWDCMHDPCAWNPPLEWEEVEKAYYHFFLSCDGKTKNNIWMMKPIDTMATINFKQGEKKRKQRMEKDREEKTCAKNQK